MKRKKWVNKVIALLLAAIMIVPSSLGTVAYAQEPEVSSEQTQTIQNADEDISEANEQETADASQKEQEKKETQETQDTESKETQKEDSYEVKLSKADNGLLSFPISEDDLVKADVENSTNADYMLYRKCRVFRRRSNLLWKSPRHSFPHFLRR